MAGRNARGFTLLEVMVALAILGLALSAILSAQAGLYSANVRARNLTVAGGAVRCKMTEIEEKLLREGLPEIDQKDDGPCCSGDSPEGMSCRWKIERIELPNPPAADVSDGGTGGDGGLGGLGALADLATNPASLGDGGISGLSSALSGGIGPTGQTGANGIAGMALTMVYPTLKPLLEASIRRVGVEVVWKEGPNERTIELVQFITSPRQGLPPGAGDPNLLQQLGGGGAGGGISAPAAAPTGGSTAPGGGFGR
jgi:general secretion pathway protein I